MSYTFLSVLGATFLTLIAMGIILGLVFHPAVALWCVGILVTVIFWGVCFCWFQT